MAVFAYLLPDRTRLGPWIVMLLIGVTVLLAPPRADRYGDRLQVALPLIALGCEAANGSWLEYAGRYVVLFAGIHGTKWALGDAALNRRPNGGSDGFPSGHTATATFGAASLVDSCLRKSPIARMVTVGAAGFVGASRIEAEKHTIWQVLAGVIWGLVCNCAGRRAGPVRRGLAALVAAGGRLAARMAVQAVTLAIGRSRTGRWTRAEKAPTPTPIHHTAV